MGFTQLLFAICFILHCYTVNSKKSIDKIEYGPSKLAYNSMPVMSAGYIIQQVTSKISYVGQLYYYQKKKALLYPNRIHNGTEQIWDETTGNTKVYYNKETSAEILTTLTPLSLNTCIVGSNRNLRFLTYNETDYTITEPIIHFNDTGYIIYSAHSDLKGRMFILLIGTNKFNDKLGKLYKIENKEVTLALDLFTEPRDFRFNLNNTKMYIVHDNGKKIAKVGYDLETGTLKNWTNVFDSTKHPILKNHIMTSVTVDRHPEHLWVSAAGKEGFILEINPRRESLISITPVPNKDLTFVTFGYVDYKTLFVGSKHNCAKGYAQGTIYAVSGMGVQGVPDRPIKW